MSTFLHLVNNLISRELVAFRNGSVSSVTQCPHTSPSIISGVPIAALRSSSHYRGTSCLFKSVIIYSSITVCCIREWLLNRQMVMMFGLILLSPVIPCSLRFSPHTTSPGRVMLILARHGLLNNRPSVGFVFASYRFIVTPISPPNFGWGSELFTRGLCGIALLNSTAYLRSTGYFIWGKDCTKYYKATFLFLQTSNLFWFGTSRCGPVWLASKELKHKSWAHSAVSFKTETIKRKYETHIRTRRKQLLAAAATFNNFTKKCREKCPYLVLNCVWLKETYRAKLTRLSLKCP